MKIISLKLIQTITIVFVFYSLTEFCYAQINSPNQDNAIDDSQVASSSGGDQGTTLEGVKVVSIDDQPIPQEGKNLLKKIHKEMLTKGYADATEEEVEHLNKFKYPKDKEDEIESMENVVNKITFKPASLEGSHWKKAKFEGAISHGALADEQWNMLTRIFTMPDGSILELEEWDFASSGGGALVTKEMTQLSDLRRNQIN